MNVKIANPTDSVKISALEEQNSTIVSGKWAIRFLQLRLLFTLFRLSLKFTRKPKEIRTIIQALLTKYKRVFGEQVLTKVSKVDDKYYWRMATPGFPSRALDKYYTHEINRVHRLKPGNGMGILFLGITKKCPLSCEHCYEWDRMQGKEKLSREDLLKIIHEYQDYGATQIQLTGGEPLMRFNDTVFLLQNAKEGTDFWIVTAGWNLDISKSEALKSAGLTGVMVSLDFHQSEDHDRFRGREGVFSRAIQSVINAKKAGLVTGLSFCPTKNYLTAEALEEYMILAKKLGVSLVNILEPKPVGRYSNQEILLSREQMDVLEDAYIKYNQNPAYKSFPIINYAGYHQRRTGCFGSGDYFMYIDTDGDAQSCPMCEKKVCNALEFSAEDTVNLITQVSGCQFFSSCETSK